MLSQRYEFADADEALLSDLALPNGTMISLVVRASLEFVDDGVFEKLGMDVGVDWTGDSGRNLICSCVDEAMFYFCERVG